MQAVIRCFICSAAWTMDAKTHPRKMFCRRHSLLKVRIGYKIVEKEAYYKIHNALHNVLVDLQAADTTFPNRHLNQLTRQTSE